MALSFRGSCLMPGSASGKLLFSNLELSFWGGVNSYTGQIIDHSHPLCGHSLTGRVLAIPSGRGSCSGSGALLELILNGFGPAGFIFQRPEHILTLGVLVARTIFDRSIPIVVLSPTEFAKLEGQKYVEINGNSVTVTSERVSWIHSPPVHVTLPRSVELSTNDKEMLQGAHGAAKAVAMEILVDFAQIQGAETLLDVTQAHIDACIYTGPACLRFAQELIARGASFKVPTTLNSISVDRRRWKELGVSEEVGQPAEDLAKAYLDMGARVSFTCAPYLLETAPKVGEQIGWAESNAVVFANSVLGARTQKYPDFLDVCIALTGRAPCAGCHRDRDRLPTLLVTLPHLLDPDDSLYPMLGYCIGKLAGPDIPLVHGLEKLSLRISDLKAFGAGFATTSSASIFHIRGVTPESAKAEAISSSIKRITVSCRELAACQQALNTALDSSVDLVSLGNPHFSKEQFAELARCCSGRKRLSSVTVIVTTSQSVQEEAYRAGYLETVADFGVDVITDTCWCMIDEPVISRNVRNLMTNSAKYAHYAPGMVRRGVHFGSLAQCIDAACKGEFEAVVPPWLLSDAVA